MSNKEPLPLERQAEIFGRYLVGQLPPQKLIRLFADSVTSAAISQAPDTYLLCALKHPRLLPYLDAYTALFQPSSALRRRLYLMCSILEASPYYLDRFIPKKRTAWYALAILFIGVRAVCRLMVGIFIAKAYVR